MCCQFFSCIITKDFKVHWSKRTMAHEDLLAELKLEDKKLEERDFVKIEIAPKDVKKVSRNRDDWTFKVDEERTLPNWYDENVVKCQGACWKAWEESVHVNLAIDKEEKTCKDQLFFAYGSAKVVAYGSATVEAYDYATVRAYGSATVRAYNSAKVVAYGSATVVAYGSAKVVAYGSATVRAYNSATVEAYGSAKVVAYGSATVEAYGSAKVVAYGSATVEAYGSATVEAYDSAKVVASDSAKVVAYGSAKVVAYGSAKVELKSDYATVLCHGKIFVTEKAIVIRASVVKAAEV